MARPGGWGADLPRLELPPDRSSSYARGSATGTLHAPRAIALRGAVRARGRSAPCKIFCQQLFLTSGVAPLRGSVVSPGGGLAWRRGWGRRGARRERDVAVAEPGRGAGDEAAEAEAHGPRVCLQV